MRPGAVDAVMLLLAVALVLWVGHEVVSAQLGAIGPRTDLLGAAGSHFPMAVWAPEG